MGSDVHTSLCRRGLRGRQDLSSSEEADGTSDDGGSEDEEPLCDPSDDEDKAADLTPSGPTSVHTDNEQQDPFDVCIGNWGQSGRTARVRCIGGLRVFEADGAGDGDCLIAVLRWNGVL